MALRSWRGHEPWPFWVATLALFLVPALGPSVQSGYSYGAVALLLGALCSLHRWPRARQHGWTLALAASFVVMGAYWYFYGPVESALGRWERPSKFWLATACLLFVSQAAPRPRAQFWGLLVGCIGAGAVALWQVHVEGEPRASGFPTGRTNAIQWGNFALLLAAMLMVQALALHAQLRRRWWLVVALAVLLALNASVLSGSRGGWLALLLAAPFGFCLLWRFRPAAVWRVLAGGVAAVAMVGALNHGQLSERWDVMERELLGYSAERHAANSVGQRLEHWRFAWDLGLERPLLGWGMDGYRAQKAERVAAGQYQPAIMEYIFVHNEPLDMFVKAGLVGVLLLLAFYAIPLCMFWPSRARVAAYAGQPPAVRSQMLALRAAGSCIPLLYAGFGLTQVYFAHNSGIMPYLFLTMLTWAALRGMDARHLSRSQAH